MQEQGRIVTRHWPLYDTRHVVYRPARLEPEVLEQGYDWAYREFYRWSSITRASLSPGTLKHQAKHFFYAAGWRKFEPLWDLVIRAKQLPQMTPLLESVLARVTERHAVDAGPDPLTTSSRSSCSSIGVSWIAQPSLKRSRAAHQVD